MNEKYHQIQSIYKINYLDLLQKEPCRLRSYAELQLEMGHRSAELLRTRYVAMEGLLRYRRGESILVG